ncbi:hypothetical protein SK128_014365, partial [Halocaridina rubra]
MVKLRCVNTRRRRRNSLESPPSSLQRWRPHQSITNTTTTTSITTSVPAASSTKLGEPPNGCEVREGHTGRGGGGGGSEEEEKEEAKALPQARYSSRKNGNDTGVQRAELARGKHQKRESQSQGLINRDYVREEERRKGGGDQEEQNAFLPGDRDLGGLGARHETRDLDRVRGGGATGEGVALRGGGGDGGALGSSGSSGSSWLSSDTLCLWFCCRRDPNQDGDDRRGGAEMSVYNMSFLNRHGVATRDGRRQMAGLIS